MDLRVLIYAPIVFVLNCIMWIFGQSDEGPIKDTISDIRVNNP